MTEKRRAPIEVLERLAEAVDERLRITGANAPQEWAQALAAYRAATAQFRTRAEVDAEIVAEVRHAMHLLSGDGYGKIVSLCSEPTTDDHGSSSTPAAKESRDNAGVSAGPANEPLEDPEPCSCDQALELQRIISHVHALALELVQVTETTPG